MFEYNTIHPHMPKLRKWSCWCFTPAASSSGCTSSSYM